MRKCRHAVWRLAASGLLVWGWCGEAQPAQVPVTFNRHIAPVLFAHCAPCHRPGQSAPFPLLTYADAKKHARQIVEVTSRRYMPPWLPDGPHGEFLDDRRLTDLQLDLLRRWVDGGAREGAAADLPPTPQFPSDWPLGPPDLVVTLAEPYSLPADGSNVYRNFVVPLELKERHFVRAMDFRPRTAAVHHALMAFDRTGTARRWDAKDPKPGFDGFTLPPGLESPPHYLGWHPGKQAVEVPRSLSWALEAGAELVLQLHLRPIGKPEAVAPQAAFYFTNEPPTNQPIKLNLTTYQISIAPGATNHVVRSSFTLAGDADVLAVAPHAHFLAREITGRARFPDGTRRVLLHIPEWDFNWQDSYRYTRPVFLSAGTALEMEVAYNNSAANPRNPNSPPQLVRYGLEANDEMAVLSLQILPRNQTAADRITDSLRPHLAQQNLEFNNYLLERDPNNVRAHVGAARVLYLMGQLEPATAQLATARKLDPQDDDAALLDGIVWQFRKRPMEARAAFEDCLRLNPNHARAHGCLAVLSIEQGWLELAERHLREALRIDPKDSNARDLLRQVVEARAKAGR